MDWKELLTKEIELTYAVSEGLLDLVDEDSLQWKPGTGVDHLKEHKAQLFYYLKLQGKPVHTGNLWGM